MIKVINKERKIFSWVVYGLLIMGCGLFSGCSAGYSSAVTVGSSGYRSASRATMDINSFCRRNNFDYEFDTLDDIVWVFSSDQEIKLILNSEAGMVNGRPIYLETPPVYSQGVIYLPSELENIVSSRQEAYFEPSYKIKTIVVDPGHGGKDPGAVSSMGLKEKDLNLQVAKLLKDDLNRKGFRVFLTRDRDAFLSLEERVDVAQRVDADLFISVHANSNRAKSVRGVEFYYLSPNHFDSQERAVSLVNKDSSWNSKGLTGNERAILWDMLLTKNYTLSMDFAHNLYSTFKRLGFNAKVPKKASFYVLKCAYVPSILVEMGYLSNQYEEKVLAKKSYQKQICEAISLSVQSLNEKHTSLVKK